MDSVRRKKKEDNPSSRIWSYFDTAMNKGMMINQNNIALLANKQKRKPRLVHDKRANQSQLIESYI